MKYHSKCEIMISCSIRIKHRIIFSLLKLLLISKILNLFVLCELFYWVQWNDFNHSHVTSVFLNSNFKTEYLLLRGREEIFIVEKSQYQVNHEVFTISDYISIRLDQELIFVIIFLSIKDIVVINCT